jgi:Spy/CpxP family protein refolding chaperone
MKYVRVLLLVLAAAMFVAPAASAQGGGGGGRGGRGMAALMQNITLTADQQAKVDTIQAKYRAERQALMPAGGGGMDSTARAKMMEMNNKMYDEIRAVLTEDQQKVFDENRKNLPQGRRGGGTGSR